MPTNVIMPQMGESVAEGTVTKWMKKVGDRVERDEPLFEISTDKVDAEIPSPAAGILTKILVQENQTVEVNTVVAEIDGAGGAAAAEAAPQRAPAEPGARARAKTVASKKVGTQEVTIPRKAPAASLEPAQSQQAVSALETRAGQAPPLRSGKIRSSPLVRRIAKEHNVDLTVVSGTGLGGRISKKDILAYIAQPARAAALPSTPVGAGLAPPGAQPAAPLRAPVAPAPAMVFTAPTQVVPMTPMRQKIAEHMVLSKHTSAHVHTVFEVEMTKVFEIRAAQAAEFERRNGLKLTFTPFFVRAAIEGIKQFPILNSSVDGTNIVYKREVNMGIAVALETGLIVPVIKHADEKNFLGIARAVTDLAERARSKRLNLDEVQGGTFTITNPGIFGSLFGTPIINQPQVAILGVGAIEKRAVVRNDAIAIRPCVYLALSFDHRIIDGAVADQFVAKVKNTLENWTEAVL